MATFGTVHIDVDTPNLPIRAEVEYNPDGYGQRKEHIARVLCGMVILIERYYTSEWTFGQNPQPVDFVHDEDDAARKVANELGEKLKNLLGE